MTSLILLALACLVPAPNPATRVLPSTGTGENPKRWPLAVIAALIVTSALAISRVSLLSAALIVAATACWLITSRNRQRRSARHDQITGDFLGTVVRRLETGATTEAALRVSAEETATDTSSDRQHVHTLALGETGGIGVLRDTAQRHGIPLAPLLVQLQERIDQRQRRRAATAASLAGPTSTAVVLSFLPLAGIALGQAMGAAPLVLLTGGGTGGILLNAGLLLIAAGLIWSQRIITKAGA